MRRGNALGPMLGRCAHLARERMDARMSRFGMTPAQTHVLRYLRQNGGQMPQRELLDRLKVKPSTVNGIVDRLVEKGMLTRSPGEKDGRCRILRLTEAGQQFYDDFESITRQIEDLIHRGMDPQETETLRRLLLRAADNLTSEEDNA